jgi:hypothetical protein
MNPDIHTCFNNTVIIIKGWARNKSTYRLIAAMLKEAGFSMSGYGPSDGSDGTIAWEGQNWKRGLITD